MVRQRNNTIVCQNGKLYFAETANYLMLKEINKSLADVQQAMLLMLQNTHEKQENVPNKELRESIMRKFEALPGEVVQSEPIIKLKKEILEEVDKRLGQSH
jgi:hypothetical protein